MEKYPAGAADVRGEEAQLFVNDYGMWSAEFRGEVIEGGESREKLVAKLHALEAKTRVKVEIPFTMVMRGFRGDNRARDGVATGVHMKNGRVLARFADTGKSEQIDPYQSNIMSPLTASEKQTYAELVRAQKDAESNLQDFLQAHRLGKRFGDYVQEAVDAAIAEKAKQAEQGQ